MKACCPAGVSLTHTLALLLPSRLYLLLFAGLARCDWPCPFRRLSSAAKPLAPKLSTEAGSKVFRDADAEYGMQSQPDSRMCGRQ